MGQTSVKQKHLNNLDIPDRIDQQIKIYHSKSRMPSMTHDRKNKLCKFIKKSNKIIDSTILVPVSPKNQAPLSRNEIEKEAWLVLQHLFQTFNQHYTTNCSLNSKTINYFESFKKPKEELTQRIDKLRNQGRSLFGMAILYYDER